MAKGTAMARRFMKMVAYILATGLRTKCTDMVPSRSQVEIHTQVSSRMTRSTAMAYSLSLTDSSTMASMRTTKSMGKVLIIGQMDLLTKEDGTRM